MNELLYTEPPHGTPCVVYTLTNSNPDPLARDINRRTGWRIVAKLGMNASWSDVLTALDDEDVKVLVTDSERLYYERGGDEPNVDLARREVILYHTDKWDDAPTQQQQRGSLFSRIVRLIGRR
jgi:hypothetical protein